MGFVILRDNSFQRIAAVTVKQEFNDVFADKLAWSNIIATEARCFRSSDDKYKNACFNPVTVKRRREVVN